MNQAFPREVSQQSAEVENLFSLAQFFMREEIRFSLTNVENFSELFFLDHNEIFSEWWVKGEQPPVATKEFVVFFAFTKGSIVWRFMISE